MHLSVVIVSWNTCDLLCRCLEALKQEIQDIEHEAFVVDNNSSDGSAQMVATKHPWVRLISNDYNAGFAQANNQALKLISGENILFLNPDTEVKPGSIHGLLSFLSQHPKAGVVAPQLINSDGTIQQSCREFPTFKGMLYELLGLSKLFPGVKCFRRYKMLDWKHDDERQVDQPEGACLMALRQVINEIGVFDEGFFMLFEEVDWCYRVKQKGWEIWFTPSCQVIHHYGQSIKQVKAKMIISSHRGLYRFWQKHIRRRHWYLDAAAYVGLMSLAYLRILAYKINKTLNQKQFFS